jgi:hypothetical protein
VRSPFFSARPRRAERSETNLDADVASQNGSGISLQRRGVTPVYAGEEWLVAKADAMRDFSDRRSVAPILPVDPPLDGVMGRPSSS